MIPVRPLNLVLLLIAAAAIAGPAWAVLSYKPAEPAKPAAYYQALAEAACKCARLKSDEAGKERCWHDFDGATRNARATAGPSACWPISERSAGLPDGTDLVISWEMVGGGSFCTKEEAISAEALYASIDSGDTNLSQAQADAATDRGIAALEQLSRRYARGERVTLAKAHGCVSGYDHEPG